MRRQTAPDFHHPHMAITRQRGLSSSSILPPGKDPDWPSLGHTTTPSTIPVARLTSPTRAGFEAWRKERSDTSFMWFVFIVKDPGNSIPQDIPQDVRLQGVL